MTITAADFTTDSDRWSYRTGARFVSPREWLYGLPQKWTADSLHMDAYTTALSEAADDNGLLLDFRPNEFYEGAMSQVLRDHGDGPGWKLRYDRFTAMLLMDLERQLADVGYLALRGNGDTKDRRLTLPPRAEGQQ